MLAGWTVIATCAWMKIKDIPLETENIYSIRVDGVPVLFPSHESNQILHLSSN